MATPTNLPAAFVSGAILTADQMNNLRGAFRILQVVSGTTTTLTTNATATYADTTLTATITPQSTTNKILVLVNQVLYHDTANGNSSVRLVRDSTTLQQQDDPVYNAGAAIIGNISFMYVDSPVTTSATTYKTTFNRRAGSGTVTVQVNSAPANIILLEVSA